MLLTLLVGMVLSHLKTENQRKIIFLVALLLKYITVSIIKLYHYCIIIIVFLLETHIDHSR